MCISQANVSTIDKTFIRGLTTAVVESSLHVNQTSIVERQLKAGNVLLQKYIDNQEQHEVQCLFAIQVLIVKMEHPSGELGGGGNLCDELGSANFFVVLRLGVGLLRKLLTLLSDEDTISLDAFKIWRDSSEEPDGKGTATLIACACLHNKH